MFISFNNITLYYIVLLFFIQLLFYHFNSSRRNYRRIKIASAEEERKEIPASLEVIRNRELIVRRYKNIIKYCYYVHHNRRLLPKIID